LAKKLKESIFLPQAHLLVMVAISLFIGEAFNGGLTGKLTSAAFARAIGHAFAMGVIPSLVALPLAVLYWAFKRDRMPGLTLLIWVIWAFFYLGFFIDILVR